MFEKIFAALLLTAAASCAADADDKCGATRFAYSCFGEDVYVTACARCEPVPNLPGVTAKRSCNVLWANMSCVADIDGHRWAGSSTSLDCVVDGGTGKTVHYSFDLAAQPGTAYMSTSETDKPVSTVPNECYDMTVE